MAAWKNAHLLCAGGAQEEPGGPLEELGGTLEEPGGAPRRSPEGAEGRLGGVQGEPGETQEEPGGGVSLVYHGEVHERPLAAWHTLGKPRS